MPEIKLTPRLQCVADMVLPDSTLADVGTDHAHLPLFLLQQGRLRGAIASDLRAGPLAHARENAAHYGLLSKISLRLAAGLEAVRPEECDAVSIAGMGGETIAAILSDAPWTQDGAHRLLLQPMTRAAALRQFLWAAGYQITQEQVCREGSRFYVVLCVQGVSGAKPQLVPLEQCQISPALLTHPLAREYLQALLRRETRAVQGMACGAVDADLLKTQRRIIENIKNALEEIS